MEHSQQPDEESTLLPTSPKPTTDRKPMLALAASAIAAVTLLTLGAVYSTNSSGSTVATSSADFATMNFGNAKYGAEMYY